MAGAPVWFGDGPDCELRLDGERLLWRGEPLIDASEVRLRGRHNLDNAMAAAAVCLARGIEPERGARPRCASSPASRTASSTSPTIGGVAYVNDSKATNVSAAAAALESFDGGVHAILGGSLKGGGFARARAGGRASAAAPAT